MIVSPQNAVDHLLSKRLITLESLVDGEMSVVDASRRNRNLKIFQRGAPGYFIKQPRIWNEEALTGVRREATCYRLIQDHPTFTSLQPYVPMWYDFDATNCILVTELLADCQTALEYHLQTGVFSIAVAVSAGTMLATSHSLNPADRVAPRDIAPFQTSPPWMLSVHRMFNHGSVSPQTSAVTDFVRIVQGYPEYGQTLEALRDQWHPASLLHGDIRFDNVMISWQADGQPRLKLIDWELAGLGDPMWDVGGMFQAYLTAWVAGGLTTADGASSAKPATRAFWLSYLQDSSISADAQDAALERSVRFAAVRMIQTAYEHALYLPQLTPLTIQLLQISMNVFKHPGEAIADLLGL